MSDLNAILILLLLLLLLLARVARLPGLPLSGIGSEGGVRWSYRLDLFLFRRQTETSIRSSLFSKLDSSSGKTATWVALMQPSETGGAYEELGCGLPAKFERFSFSGVCTEVLILRSIFSQCATQIKGAFAFTRDFELGLRRPLPRPLMRRPT